MPLMASLENFLNHRNEDQTLFKAFEWISVYYLFMKILLPLVLTVTMHQTLCSLVVSCRQTVERVTLQSQLQQLLEAQKSEGKSLPSSPR